MCKQLGVGALVSCIKSNKGRDCSSQLDQLTFYSSSAGITGREHPAQDRSQEWWGPLHMHHPVLREQALSLTQWEQALSLTQQDTGFCFQPHSPGDVIEKGKSEDPLRIHDGVWSAKYSSLSLLSFQPQMCTHWHSAARPASRDEGRRQSCGAAYA